VSSREDAGRYRGRRRAPSPPRARYAAVVTTAFVGAGVVALGSAVSMDTKADGPDLSSATMSSAAFAASGADRQAVDRASRSDARSTATTPDQIASDLWLLPLKNYTVAAPFGQTGGDQGGIDLAAHEGMPYFAAHSGTVKLARYDGAFGYSVVIDAGNGVSLVYAHSSQLLVHEGQRVEAGEPLGLVGCSGYAFTTHLHFEVQQHGTPVNPLPFLLAHGVDLANGTSAVDG
jgi:murein DD-endopeptidase MepM/ murein hydrolase activator NlpD